MKYLTRKDELMLLAVLRLDNNAYLVSLRDLLNKSTRKKWSIGNIFVSLEKLEEFGYIQSTIGEPTAKRGGKAIKFYTVTGDGLNALKVAKSIQDEMWDGLHDVIFNN
ncbi:PadR family transcriptional regulator [candidate division KSB1 bacterium]